MVYLQLLDDFTVYRTKPPVIMPENRNDRKHGQLYAVLAPSIEEEMRYLSHTSFVKYKNLTKYFIEKKWESNLKGVGQRTIYPNRDGGVTSTLNAHRSGNLAKIDGVTSFAPGTKNSPMRNLNVLYEINHVTSAILTNPKDSRLLSDKVADLNRELHRLLADCSYVGNYGERTLLIPTDLWFTDDELSNPANLMRQSTTNHNVMGIFLGKLTPSWIMMNTLTTLVLVDRNVMLRLSFGKIPNVKDDKQNSTFSSLILKFLTVAGRNRRRVAGDVPDIEFEAIDEEDISDDPAITSLRRAEEETVDDIRTEKVLRAMNVDETKVSEETVEKVKKAIKTANSRSNTAASTAGPGPKRVDRGHGATEGTKPAPTSIKKNPPVSVPDDAAELATGSYDGAITEELNNTVVPDAAKDLIIQAKMEGRSVASEKRNQVLREKYRTLSAGNTPIVDIIEESRSLDIPTTTVSAHVVGDDMRNIRGQLFEEKYDETLYSKDLISILMHFAGVDPALYLNKNIEIDDVSTSTDRVLRYGVEFEDENRKRHRFHFRLPKMYKHKYLYLNGQEMQITHQKFPFPITKVRPDRCQLVTNYNKIFIYRYGAAISPRMIKLKKILSSNGYSNVTAKRGNSNTLNRGFLTSVEYDEIGSMFTQIHIGTTEKEFSVVTKFYFVRDEADIAFGNDMPPKTVESTTDGKMVGDSTLIPIAKKERVYRSGAKSWTNYYISGSTNQVYDFNGEAQGELSEFMINLMTASNDALAKEFANTTAGTRYMYSRAHIMDQEIPLILVMGAADPNGLIGALEKGKINYSFVDKRPVVDKSRTGVIPFSDGYLVFDRYPFENSLLLNGLTCIPTKEYGFFDLNTRDAYVEIFDDMCGQRTLADNMPAFYHMMVDPITKDVLKRLNMPTDFTVLLHWCNGVLADNQFQIDSNYENSRIRSNEIIMAHLYRELAVAWSNYRSGRTDTFSIPEDAIIKILLTSKIVDPKSKLNITLELENDRNIKLKGPSGMNEDHSYTIEKRAYHPSMKGIVGTNSTASGEIGINRHMVTDPNIEDARGFISIENKREYSGAELLTPGEMLSPFSAESSDIERLCMSISQAKHLVPVENQCSPAVSFDFERVAPYLSRDFAFVSRLPGKVIELAEDLMIVQYKDGTTEDIDLSKHPAKNTDGGFYIMNKMDTNLKVGSTFAANQILAYDRKVFNNLDFFGDPCANVGTLARVSFESNGLVFEDSGYITDSFAHRFATRVTKQKRVILSKYANVVKMVNVGDQIQANDVIIAFDDTEDEFSSKLLASIAEQIEDEDEVVATSAPVRSKISGTIADIDVTYTVPLDEMSPSLRKIVETYIKRTSKREKIISKHGDLRDANTLLKSSEISVPDQRGKVAGTTIGDGVMIDFYIEYLDIAGNGDKGSIGALKFTDCTVIPDELAAFAESNPDRKIDVYVASFGAFKRMVADVEKVGVLTKVLVETKRKMKDKYGQRIKDELRSERK